MNNSRILSIKNAKFSGYYFYMNLNIKRNFQICISVPLMAFLGSAVSISNSSLTDLPNSSFIPSKIVRKFFSDESKYLNAQKYYWLNYSCETPKITENTNTLLTVFQICINTFHGITIISIYREFCN